MSLSKIADVIVFVIVTLLLVLCGIEFFGVKVTFGNRKYNLFDKTR